MEPLMTMLLDHRPRSLRVLQGAGALLAGLAASAAPSAPLSWIGRQDERRVPLSPVDNLAGDGVRLAS